jgi:hypothetical protein
MFENHCLQNETQRPQLSWRIARIVAFAIGGVCLAALFALLLGVVVQWLWNWLMPVIFNLKPITFWQSVGLIFLAKLLVGGFHPHPNPHPKRGISRDPADHWGYYKGFWREKGEKATEDLINQARKDKNEEGK